MDTSWLNSYLMHANPALTELGVTAPRMVGDFGTVLRTWVSGFLASQASATDIARVEGERNDAIEDVGRLRNDLELTRAQLRDARAEVGRLNSVTADSTADIARMSFELVDLRGAHGMATNKRQVSGAHLIESVSRTQAAIRKASDEVGR